MVEEGEISYITTLDDFLNNPYLFYSKFGQNRNILILPRGSLERTKYEDLTGSNIYSYDDFSKISELIFSNGNPYDSNLEDVVQISREDAKKTGRHIELEGIVFPNLRIPKIKGLISVSLTNSAILRNLDISNRGVSGDDVEVGGVIRGDPSLISDVLIQGEQTLEDRFGEVPRLEADIEKIVVQRMKQRAMTNPETLRYGWENLRIKYGF